MQGKLIVLKADGAVEATDLTAPPGLSALQAAVGGYIEIVPGFDRYDGKAAVAVCNEEGKLHGLPFNQSATSAWDVATDGAQDDILVGDVAIVTGDAELLEAM